MKSIHLSTYPAGMINQDNFLVADIPMPSIGHGEVLVENIYCSTDPYQRGRMISSRFTVSSSRFPAIELGKRISGESVGKVVESNSPLYSIGDYILHTTGWEEYSVLGDFPDSHVPRKFNPGDNIDEGCLNHIVTRGLVGRTAYYSLVQCMNIKPGDVIAISGACGGVGHIMIQLALKLGAAKVYGITSTEEKANIVASLGGTPIVVPKNTKLSDLVKIMDDNIHEELDHYHENVGNNYFTGAMKHMAVGGNIIYCGVMSIYNNTMPTPGPNIMALIYNDVKIRGCFLTNLNYDHFNAFMDIHGTDLTCLTTVYDGLNELPTQFVDHFVLPDTRLGKSLCKIR